MKMRSIHYILASYSVFIIAVPNSPSWYRLEHLNQICKVNYLMMNKNIDFDDYFYFRMCIDIFGSIITLSVLVLLFKYFSSLSEIKKNLTTHLLTRYKLEITTYFKHSIDIRDSIPLCQKLFRL